MKQYISKAAVVTEIERRMKLRQDGYRKYNSVCDFIAFEELEYLHDEFLPTLETKEVDLENSIVCKVGWHDGFLLDYTQEQQDELLEKIGANVGDKVRVILIKGTEF